MHNWTDDKYERKLDLGHGWVLGLHDRKDGKVLAAMYSVPMREVCFAQLVRDDQAAYEWAATHSSKSAEPPKADMYW